MQNHLRTKEVHIMRETQIELKKVEHDAVEGARKYFESGKVGEVVCILLDLDNEVDLIVKEGRRLRLEGKLDMSIYNVLIDGYSHTKERIYKVAEHYGYFKQISSLHNFNRHAIKLTKQAQ